MMRLTIVAGLALLTCGGYAPTPVGVPRIPTAVWMTPPPRFESEFREAEKCSGLTGKYDGIVWYVVPGANFRDPVEPDEWLLGLWVKPDTIYISAQWERSWVPRHEMLHYLRGDGAHPKDVFGEACHALTGYLVSDDPDYRP
jgi:hypothetical protein